MADPKPKTKKVPGLRVRALVDGFRRGGRAWNVGPVDVPLADLNKTQIALLRDEPQLVVEDIEIEVAAAE